MARLGRIGGKARAERLSRRRRVAIGRMGGTAFARNVKRRKRKREQEKTP